MLFLDVIGRIASLKDYELKKINISFAWKLNSEKKKLRRRTKLKICQLYRRTEMTKTRRSVSLSTITYTKTVQINALVFEGAKVFIKSSILISVRSS